MMNSDFPQPAAGDAVRVVAWVRYRSDGGVEGPILDSVIEDVRRKSGVWKPLVHPALPAAAATSSEIASFEQWYAIVDARLWNNWDACNAAFHAGRKMAPSAAPVPAVPDTYCVLHCPPWPGGIEFKSLSDALDNIREHGNQDTCLATWSDQYQRRDYTAEEVRAMLAAAKPGAEREVPGKKHDGPCWRNSHADCGC